MSNNTDVIVVGGGMVGALAAAALGDCGVDVVLLEQKTPPAFDEDNYDLRVSALSESSQRMIDAVGAWQHIQSLRSCPYRRMLVWDSESTTQTMFDSSRIGKPCLGHIVENRVIQLVLWQRIKQLENVTVVCPATTQSVVFDTDQVTVSTDAG
ncbi:MAG: FAD-dependent monooxygenase, partial [Pseudomonadota bacterium]